nr:MAG TPA: hypothetical protein [Myoviridae sp. ctNPX13]
MYYVNGSVKETYYDGKYVCDRLYVYHWRNFHVSTRTNIGLNS